MKENFPSCHKFLSMKLFIGWKCDWHEKCAERFPYEPFALLCPSRQYGKLG